MNAAKTKALVFERWQQQQSRCYYCFRRTWVPRKHRPEHAVARLGVPKRLLGDLRATAEHLHKRSDGGPDKPENIVMACYWCNTTRGERNVLAHVKWCRGIFSRQQEIAA